MSKKDENDIYLEEDADAIENTRDTANDKIAKIKKKLKKCEEDKKMYLENWRRAQADFVNARKLDEAEKQRAILFAGKSMVKELIPVLDSFEAALEADSTDGVENIHNQLKGVLKSFGVEGFGEVGEEFNPHKHEAVGTEEGEEGIILRVLAKGYIQNEEIIRSAKVIVGA